MSVPDIMPYNDNDNKNDKKTCVINVADGLSYDTALRSHSVAGRHVITVSVNTLLCAFSDILSDLSIFVSDENKKMVNRDIYQDILESIKAFGYSKITLNFECCSDYGFGPLFAAPGFINGICDCGDRSLNSHSHYYFIDKNTSLGVIRVIAHMLKNGSQVICSDFAAKALIFNWIKNKDVFNSECPFQIVGSTSGSIHVKYDIETCKTSPFPQLAALSSVAVPDTADCTISSCTMNAMVNTIIYGVNPIIDKSLDLKVYSVAVCKINEENKFINGKIINGKIINEKIINEKKKEGDNKLDVMLPIVQLQRNDGVYQDQNQDKDINLVSLPSLPSLPSQNPKIPQKLNLPCNETKEETMIPFIENQEHFTKLGTNLSQQVQGFPVHTVVLFEHFKGSLVISSLHLSNLVDVKTNFTKVIDSATMYLGRQRSVELEELLLQAAAQTPELVRSVTSSIVTEITSSVH